MPRHQRNINLFLNYSDSHKIKLVDPIYKKRRDFFSWAFKKKRIGFDWINYLIQKKPIDWDFPIDCVI